MYFCFLGSVEPVSLVFMTTISLHAQAILMIFLALLITGLLIRILFTRLWTKKSRFRELVFNFSISIVALLVITSSFEVYFRLAVYRSDFFGFSLAAKNWWYRYWDSVNSYKYRSPSLDFNELNLKKSVLVLGDSIVAGHGINQVENRFTNILNADLGDSWSVVNAAICGWNTSHELQALRKHLSQFKPEVVVLTYFLNDIEGAAEKAGIKKPVYTTRPEGIMAGLVDNSHFINFIYWRLYRYLHSEIAEFYRRHLQSLWANPKVWEIHSQELREIYALSISEESKFIFVLMPDLLQYEESKRLTVPVKDLFKDLGVPTLDLHDFVSAETAPDYIVGSYDSHPNEALHAVVADRLYGLIEGSDFAL